MNKAMRLLALVCAAWLAQPAAAVHAAYPDKPIRLIVSFPPGSGTDSNARYVARKMEERLGVAVTVENRPGGNSFIAAQAVALVLLVVVTRSRGRAAARRRSRSGGRPRAPR